MKWKDYPHLRARPAKPALGRGRIQRQVQRAFIARGPVVSASEIYDWTHAGRRSGMRRGARRSVWVVLRAIAVPVGRATTRGLPTLWQLVGHQSPRPQKGEQDE
jgi:hypothetical protein